MVWGNQNQGLAHTRQVNYTDWHWKPSFYLHLNCRTSFVPGLGHSVYFINITQYAYGMYPFCGWDSSVHFLDGTEFHWIDILLIFFFFLLLKGVWIVSSLETLQITCLWTFWYMPHMPSIWLLMPHPRSPECALINLRRHRETAEKHCVTVHSFQPRRKCRMSFLPEDVVFIRVFTIRLCMAVQPISFHCPMS